MIDKQSIEAAFHEALDKHEFAFEKFFLVRFLGLTFSYGEATCTATLVVQSWMHNPRQVLHGGIVSLGLDVSMGHLLAHEAGPAATVETKVQYLRPVSRGEVRFEASFVKRGRTLQIMQSRMIDADGRLAALATSTWQMVPAA